MSASSSEGTEMRAPLWATLTATCSAPAISAPARERGAPQSRLCFGEHWLIRYHQNCGLRW